MVDLIPDKPKKGRGAVSNASGRYEPFTRVAVDDGWGRDPGSSGFGEAGFGEDPPPRPTEVIWDATRTIITRNTSPDIPFDRSINPYRGCEHGCIYCFARPSHAWLGYSPGLDFETKLLAKPEAAELLRRELARKNYRPRPMALGTNTDPYQPIEKKLQITRRILEVLRDTGHPLTIVTKSNLILRDLDILAPMARKRQVRVMISLTTLDRKLSRVMEPRAPTPAQRLEALRTLNAAGVPAGVLTAPMIPAINDQELEALLEAAARAGAAAAGYVLLRLPLEIKELFEEWLEAHFPDRKSKVLNLIRDTRGGRLNQSEFGLRQSGSGVYAELLGQRFKRAEQRLGLNRGSAPLDSSQFTPPKLESEADKKQLSLL
ncbi:PA0069 family radical SAM protein [Pelagibius litoralis]|uniref:PA0069 family radical SAM protein n=1 Tax=Pelagibius litoralis TaxID=374515 RepID=A0A967F216_9PROT|nr:PA0069 family radical SAM protein [Pelagibius litoralis]NIA71602.1 PA0069 family radical SAM protein [Pelagibius litoralis]